MKEICLVFPHQLLENSPLIALDCPVYLVEEWLYFNQYQFHKQKIAFQRASMKAYERKLKSKNKEVYYISATEEYCDIRKLIATIDTQLIHYIDPVDDWLEQRIYSATAKKVIELIKYDSPLFLNEPKELQNFFRKDKNKFHQTTFYKKERKRLAILLHEDGKPIGGKWTYDKENRKKYPAKKSAPIVHYPKSSKDWAAAVNYVNLHFEQSYGHLNPAPIYPTTHQQAKEWMTQFFEFRFHEFGAYEDAIVANESILNHSILSPLLNTGLLTPDIVIEEALHFAKNNTIPLNSLEGFIRQIIGWREFIRGIYTVKGAEQRTRNFWNFKLPIPSSFYTASTGIPPIDQTIKKVLATGYCHHIERLMILANFMTLCEFHPDAIYQWFMELFIDSYDWVMVPNVYGMATFSDGGLMSTKPYISSSNYIMKMSDYKAGDWQNTWDALFWRFMHKHRAFFESNPRLALLLRNLDKKSKQELQSIITTAETFIQNLE